MSDYHLQAEFLIARGYVSGMTVDQLANKLSAKSEKPTPDACCTRESVYDEEGQKTVEKMRNEASETQKRLIQPGERTSAALERKARMPLNQFND